MVLASNLCPGIHKACHLGTLAGLWSSELYKDEQHHFDSSKSLQLLKRHGRQSINAKWNQAEINFIQAATKGGKETDGIFALQRHPERPEGKLFSSVFILTHWLARLRLSSSSLHHLFHFSDLDCFSLWKPSLPIAGRGGRGWCPRRWVEQTAGFSHRGRKGVCLCSQLCVCARVRFWIVWACPPC